MAHALMIGEAERKQIAELKAFAAATPRDALASKAAADQNIAAFRDEARTMAVHLPVGFAVVYTQEVQPNAPPPGLCHHISISVDTPYRVPHPAAVEMILEEFGMRPIAESDHLYWEDISPGEKAVNVLQLVDVGEV
jgi:hypothetical protein